MKTWGEMTDEEQGALLLAHHRGEVIEFMNGLDVKDWKDAEPRWAGWCYYRVKKEPVVKTVNQVIMHSVTQTFVEATCTYRDGKLTKIHWEADE